jgi:hypothetical protein
MKQIYYIMLENLSLFFYKCEDPVYLLEKCKIFAQEKDFWIRVEDLLMRSKSTFTVLDLARITKVYSEI